MSLETRSTSALFKRAEQLKRWQESETSKEPNEPKLKSRKIQFTDGCVFLASCAASDRDEVDRLLRRGADIDTANVDGLTALHQACIDDNLDMVEFLVQRSADVNRGDNEGWTPLHATASCGFLSIARYLLDHGASVSAVNNDGELAIDISESDEMEELLQKEIDNQGVNCEESRHTEERLMLEDARQWYNSKQFGDVAHTKTGATALHVASAKGYLKVMGLLIQGGAAVNSQDFDGWTPLHAAAHWAQKEACDMLCENYCNMEIKNHVGQTAFDVADPDLIPHLHELKKKQATMQKDRPDITSLINRPAVPSISTTQSKPSNRRPSITRISGDAKDHKKELWNSQDSLKSVSLPETIQEKAIPESPTIIHPKNEKENVSHSQIASSPFLRDDNKIPNFTPPQIEEKEKSNSSLSTTGESDANEAYPWRRPHSLRIRSTQEVFGSSNRLSPSTDNIDVQIRRNHSFDERRKPEGKQDSELSNSIFLKKDAKNAQNQNPVRRSFVPPVRDEESETQRKAHAKRVRETRRSTQGVTLEDLKSAEQLVKKKQQLENQQRTSELQQLVASQHSTTSSYRVPSTTVTTTSVSSLKDGFLAGSQDDNDKHDRAPSWKVRLAENTKNKFQSDASDNIHSSSGSLTSNKSHYLPSSLSPSHLSTSVTISESSSASGSSSSLSKRTARFEEKITPSVTLSTPDSKESREASDTLGTNRGITRKKKPKRRSTGVVDAKLLDEGDGDGGSLDEDDSLSSEAKVTDHKRERNGEIDYKKLYEESQQANTRLKEDLEKLNSENALSKKKLDDALKVANSGGLTETEKKEKKALEKKLCEMEEELKQLEHLKNDNQRLRDENGALIRVISKLSK